MTHKRIRPLPKIVYKFRPWHLEHKDKKYENSRKIFSDCTIYFSSATEFNDPFDLDIVPNYKLLTPSDWKKKLTLLLEYGKLVRWHSDEHLNTQIQKKLEGDPLPIWYKESELEDLGFAMLNSYRSAGGIFSTSANNSNILLWSHYAENHYGISIGFNGTSLREDTNSNYGFVIYTDDLKKPDIKPEINKRLDDIFKSFNFKAPYWKYEDEIRFFKLPLDDHERISKINPSTVKEVIFGCQMDTKTKRRTYEQIRGFKNFDHVKFYSAHKKPNYFELNIKPFDLKYFY